MKWTWVRNERCYGPLKGAIIRTDTGLEVASVNSRPFGSQDACEEHAAMMAAAPELLAACEKLAEYAREVAKHVSHRKSEAELENILADAIILAVDAAKKAKGT